MLCLKATKIWAPFKSQLHDLIKSTVQEKYIENTLKNG